MLSRILIDGYKSIDRMELELNNFTLLSGVNSAGKSSVIQAVLYMTHMMEKPGQYTMKYHYELGKFIDIRNTVKGNKEICIELDTREKGPYAHTAQACIFPDGAEDKMDFAFDRTGDNMGYMDWHRVIYLSVERTGAQNFYPLSLGDPFEIGGRGEYAFSCLALCGQDALRELDFAYEPEEIGLSMSNQVNYWLEYLMGFRVRTNIVQEVDQVVVTYSNVGNNRYYRAQNVGTGITYMSMLIIAALSCRKGDTLIIENPEIHMHARAQSRFMELVAYLSGRGLQVILETHSDHIYNGMRKCLKNKKLLNQEAVVYYLELDENMQTKVSRIRFNDQGAEENHPQGLFDQFDDDLDELLGI